jgi:hypothetical protein
MILIKTSVNKLEEAELEKSLIWKDWEEETRFDNWDDNDWRWDYCDDENFEEDSGNGEYYYYPYIAGGA